MRAKRSISYTPWNSAGMLEKWLKIKRCFYTFSTVKTLAVPLIPGIFSRFNDRSPLIFYISHSFEAIKPCSLLRFPFSIIMTYSPDEESNKKMLFLLVFKLGKTSETKLFRV